MEPRSAPRLRTAAHPARLPRWASAYLAVVGLTVAASMWQIASGLPTDGFPVEDAAWLLVFVTFSAMGVLVATRRPENAVGWLMLVPSVAWFGDVLLPSAPATAPAHVDAGVWLATWWSTISWVPLIFPVLLMLALFPTGRALTRRWRWHTRLAVGMVVAFVLDATFGQPLQGGSDAAPWQVDNPLGLFPDVFGLPGFVVVWMLGLVALTVGALAALAVRYRRARWRERQQLKWMLFAVSAFTGVYDVGLMLVASDGEAPWSGVLLALGVLVIPVCMAIAILRHQVLDIDVLIRRTVTYAVVTGLLAVIYVALVLLLQPLARSVTGNDSDLTVAGSTLVVAALFHPVRRRTQDLLGRRFFRRAYDVDRTLDAFGARVRDVTDPALLATTLLGVVGGTLHPQSASLWHPPAE